MSLPDASPAGPDPQPAEPKHTAEGLLQAMGLPRLLRAWQELQAQEDMDGEGPHLEWARALPGRLQSLKGMLASAVLEANRQVQYLDGTRGNEVPGDLEPYLRRGMLRVAGGEQIWQDSREAAALSISAQVPWALRMQAMEDGAFNTPRLRGAAALILLERALARLEGEGPEGDAGNLRAALRRPQQACAALLEAQGVLVSDRPQSYNAYELTRVSCPASQVRAAWQALQADQLPDEQADQIKRQLMRRPDPEWLKPVPGLLLSGALDASAQDLSEAMEADNEALLNITVHPALSREHLQRLDRPKLAASLQALLEQTPEVLTEQGRQLLSRRGRFRALFEAGQLREDEQVQLAIRRRDPLLLKGVKSTTPDLAAQLLEACPSSYRAREILEASLRPWRTREYRPPGSTPDPLADRLLFRLACAEPPAGSDHARIGAALWQAALHITREASDNRRQKFALQAAALATAGQVSELEELVARERTAYQDFNREQEALRRG